MRAEMPPCETNYIQISLNRLSWNHFSTEWDYCFSV